MPAIFLVIQIVLCLVPLSAHAVPAITCHCFKDRAYDPARPTVADPYFLATTQNSFFALAFDTDKKSIVMNKQQGASADDLWVAYWVGSRTGTAPDSLLQAKSAQQTWKDVIASRGLAGKNLGTRFAAALKGKTDSSRLAEAVVDELFSRNQLLGEAELAALRKAGAPNQELVLATLIGARTKKPAKQVYLDVMRGAKSWGSLLQEARIEPKDIHREVAGMLKAGGK